MYICDVWNCIYHFSANYCYANERKAIDTMDTRACPACNNLDQIKKEAQNLLVCRVFQKRVVEAS